MRTEKSPTRMDCSAFKRSSSSGDAPPLTRLSGISAGTALGDGPLVLSSPTGSLFGCIVSSGADEPGHDVTTIAGRCCDLRARKLETAAAGNLGWAPALVCRGRDGVRASHIDRGPPAAGDPQVDCG